VCVCVWTYLFFCWPQKLLCNWLLFVIHSLLTWESWKNPPIPTRIILYVVIFFCFQITGSNPHVRKTSYTYMYRHIMWKKTSQNTYGTQQSTLHRVCFILLHFYFKYRIKAYSDFELSQCPRELIWACSKTWRTFTGVRWLELTLGLFTVFR
jgi:hypothetical protein